MAKVPFRIDPESSTGLGRLIDRERIVRFRFDGHGYQGFAGDTLASALLANGVRVFSRSAYLQRPRGIMGAGADEADGRVMLRGKGGRQIAVRATETPIHDGLRARSIRGSAAARLLIAPLHSRFGAMMRAGAAFKTFKAPGRISWDLFEPLVRRLTSGPPEPRGTAGGRYEHFHLHCDVLVIGGGVAGICAARAAAAGGARVVLCEQAARFGGLADIYPARIEGLPAADWLNQQCAALARTRNVHLLANTRVAGTLGSGEIAAVEQCIAPGAEWFAGGEETVRERVWRISARRVILATGARERGFLFADNDRPGLMMSSAARAYLHRFGVLPGRRGVIYTNNDDAYLTAVLLHQAGVEISRIVDTRPNPEGIAIGHAMGAGLHLSFGSAVSELKTVKGGTQITGVAIVPTTRAAARRSAAEPVACDFVCISAGWDPVLPGIGSVKPSEEAMPRFDEERQIILPGASDSKIAIGGAGGTLGLSDIIAEAGEAGMAAAREEPFSRDRFNRHQERASPSDQAHRFAPASWTVYPPEEAREPNRHFVDLRADLTVADLRLAVREGYRAPSQLCRYIGLDAANGRQGPPDINALAVIADCRGLPLARIAGDGAGSGPALSLGALAGLDIGKLRAPQRRLPLAAQHAQQGARFYDDGDWQLPLCYPGQGESEADAMRREARCLRQGVGVMDLSARGTFEFSGPEAAEMLAALTGADLSSLVVGTCGLAEIRGDHGGLIGMSIVGRRQGSRYVLITAAETAPLMRRRIASLMGEGPQRRHVLMSEEGEQWAHLAVCGPQAREVLRWLPVRHAAWDDATLPAGALREMAFGGNRLRVMRVGEFGGLQYELSIGAGHAGGLWRSLGEAGKKAGLMPVGMGARDLLLLETGRSRTVTGDGGRDVVGLLGEEPNELLAEGARVVLEDALGQSSIIAHVGVSRMSPNLEHAIALAAITDGRALIGRQVRILSESGETSAEIVDPAFHTHDRQQNDG